MIRGLTSFMSQWTSLTKFELPKMYQFVKINMCLAKNLFKLPVTICIIFATSVDMGLNMACNLDNDSSCLAAFKLPAFTRSLISWISALDSDAAIASIF